MEKPVFAICLAVMVSGCGNLEEQVRARIWTGGNGEIVRDVVVDGLPKTEFLPTNSPTFLDFRCMHRDDAEELVRLAVRYCQNPAQKRQ